MALRNFSNSAVETQLAVTVTDSSPVLQLTSVTGWPAAPFTIIVDADEITEEVCLVTGLSGTTATVTRGFNGTSAVAHTAGAKVKHAAVAADFIEANAHVNAVDGVHGVLGDVVGTSDSQTLTNKTISGASNTLSNIPQSAVTNLVSDLAAKAVYPSQTGQSGKVLGTNGTAVSWVVPLAGPAGPTGPAGADGVDGAPGADGADGVGVPAGGTTGQVLAKNSNTDYDTAWVAAGGGSSSVAYQPTAPSSPSIGDVWVDSDGVMPEAALPTGGSAGQVLAKATGADYDVAWQSGPGLVLIATQSFTAASAVSVNNCFTSAYDNYAILITDCIVATSAQQLRIRMRAGGVDDSTASSYHWTSGTGGGTYSGVGSSTDTSGIAGIAGNVNISNVEMDICGPAKPQATAASGTHYRAGTGVGFHGFVHNVASAFDGFTIYPAANTFTGTLYVYGYRKAL